MKYLSIAAIALLLLAPPAMADDYTVDDLAWIAGYWTNVATEGRISEELWLEPGPGHIMVGINRDVRGDRAFFEYLRIEQRDDGVYYVAKPSNQPGAAFRLIELVAGTRAVFDNPEHDFPQRMTYELADNVITVTISGVVEGETRSGNFTFTRARFDREMK